MYVIAALQSGNVLDGSFLFQKSIFFILKREDPYAEKRISKD
jgi:hypothetical protein